MRVTKLLYLLPLSFINLALFSVFSLTIKIMTTQFQVCFYNLFFLMQITKIPRRSLFDLFRHFWRRFVNNRNESRRPLAICAPHSAIIYTWGMESPISALFRTHLLYFWLPNFSFTNKLKWWMIFDLILLQIIRRNPLELFFYLFFCLQIRHILCK